MDCWHSIAVRAELPDAVQRWAQLEGKSPVMCEELAQRYAPRKPTRRQPFSNGTVYVELIAVALKAWWHFYSG